MENTVWYTILIGIGILVIVATGIILNRTGSPYRITWITLHKLISLAFIFLCILGFIKRFRIETISSAEAVALTIFGLSLFTALVTGGVLSHKNVKIFILAVIHTISTILLIGALILIVYSFFTHS